VNTHSLRARLTLWYTMTLVVVLLLFGVDVLLVQQRFGMRRADRELETVNATLVNLFREELGELDDPATAATEAITAIASLGDAAAILDAGGSPLAARLEGLSLEEAEVAWGRRRRVDRWRGQSRVARPLFAAAVRRCGRDARGRASACGSGARTGRSARGDVRGDPGSAAAGRSGRLVARVDRTAAGSRHGTACRQPTADWPRRSGTAAEGRGTRTTGAGVQRAGRATADGTEHAASVHGRLPRTSCEHRSPSFARPPRSRSVATTATRWSIARRWR
jgi:hypothetical protein